LKILTQEKAMAKQQAFADKVAKQQKSGHAGVVVKFVESKKTSKGSWKFVERQVKLSSLDEVDKVK